MASAYWITLGGHQANPHHLQPTDRPDFISKLNIESAAAAVTTVLNDVSRSVVKEEEEADAGDAGPVEAKACHESYHERQ